jgi:hypothetical protein
LAKDGDFASIATESSNVVMDPLQGQTLIKKAQIQRIIGNCQSAG